MPIDVNGEPHYSTEEMMEFLAVEGRRVQALMQSPPWHENRDEEISESRAKKQNKALKERVMFLEAALQAAENPDQTRRDLEASVKDLATRLAKANQIIKDSQKQIRQARKAIFDVERALEGHTEKTAETVPEEDTVSASTEPPVTF